MSFHGKNVLVTGAGKGIGLAASRLMLELGATVAAADRDRGALDALLTASQQHAPRLGCHAFDIALGDGAERLAGEVAQRLGRIDCLVHAAGVYSPEKPLAQCSDAEWRGVLDVNLDGAFRLCRAVIPHLSDRSAIVLVSSIAGHLGSRLHASYAASKGAILALARSLAADLAPRTRVNVVSPGVIETRMTQDFRNAERGKAMLAATPLQRFGTADEVAGPIAFLCSDLSSFITGETIQVNGGLYIS